MAGDSDFPPRNLSNDEELAKFAYDAAYGIPIYEQGYDWFWSVFQPAIERYEKSDDGDSDYLSWSYYCIGDVHDLNGASWAAIHAYRKAVSYDSNNGAAYREMAKCFSKLGLYPMAKKINDKARFEWPHDPDITSDREQIDSESKDEPMPLTPSEVAVADALEQLARKRPAQAIERLSSFQDQESLQVRLRAHGALEDIPAYFETWREYLVEADEMFFWPQDYFFMPEKVWCDPKIWSLFRHCGLPFGGWFSHYEGLDDKETQTATDPEFMALSTSDRIAKKLDYYIAYHGKDLDGLKALARGFPNWVELHTSILSLET